LTDARNLAESETAWLLQTRETWSQTSSRAWVSCIQHNAHNLMRPRSDRQHTIDRLPAHPTVREVAYRRLRQLIVDGTLPPGQRIFENELADQLGISRTPLREALRQLETEGLVKPSARRGAIVSGLSAPEMEEEFLIRATLEGLAIRLAAPRLTADDYA